MNKLQQLINKQKEELKGLEITIPDGELKSCLVYHEATATFIEENTLNLLQAIVEMLENNKKYHEGDCCSSCIEDKEMGFGDDISDCCCRAGEIDNSALDTAIKYILEAKK